MPLDKDPVEELLTKAQAMVQAERFNEAIAVVRRAHHLAPLRQDIREILATLLEATAAEDDVLPFSYSENRTDTQRVADREGVPAPQRSVPLATSNFAQLVPEDDTDHRALDDSLPRRREERAAAVHDPYSSATASAPLESVRSLFGTGMSEGRRAADELETGAEPETPRLSFWRRLADSVASSVLGDKLETWSDRDGNPDQIPERRSRPTTPEIAQPRSDREVLQPSRWATATAVREPVNFERPGRRPATQAESPSIPIMPLATKTERVLPEAGERDASGAAWRMPGLVIYGFVLAFIGTASAVSYFRFFHEWDTQPVMVSSKDARVPSLSSPEAKPATQASTKIDKSSQTALTTANRYIADGRYDDAITLLSPLAATNSQSPAADEAAVLLAKAHDAKGGFLLEANRLEESAAEHRKAAALQPRDPQFRLRLGNALYYCGMLIGGDESARYLTEALQEVNASIELDRENVHAYERLATVYEGLRENAQAKAAWDKVAKMAPQSESARTARDRINLLSSAR